MMRTFIKSESGFSLTELMIVLVIIGILVLLALPRFMPVVDRAKTMEAQINLRQVHMLQQAFKYERDRYSENLREIGYRQEPTVDDGGTARYLITIERADVTGYLARATSVVPFDDGLISIWEVDETGTIRQTQ
jgi:type IV pilus assembly protein PilE